MTLRSPSPIAPLLAVAPMLLMLLLAAAGCATQQASSGRGLPASDADPRATQVLVRPAELAAQLAATGEKPMLLHVGFQVLYRGGAIPGTRYVGPGSNPEGLASLRTAVAGVPHDRAIVIYCGCCPWDHCPNMRPAYQALVDLGFTHVRALYTPKNLESDWVDAGYPIEKPTP